MSLFRSETMSLCQMILHTESAFNCLIVLGYEGKVQFCNIFDGFPLVNEQFSNEVKRCQEMQHLISSLQQAAVESGIKLVIYPDVDKDEIPEVHDLKVIEALVQQFYEGLIAVNSSLKVLRTNYLLLKERLQVMVKADEFFGYRLQDSQLARNAWSDSLTKLLMKNEYNLESAEIGMHLSFFTGSIPWQRFQAFELMLWRITKGCFLLNQAEFILETTSEARKYVFMVVFLGQEMKNKIRKICEGFGIKLFQCSESRRERQEEQQLLTKELSDMQMVLDRTETQRYNLLLVASADLYIWHVKVKKILMAYYTLNRFSRVRHLHVQHYLQAECWIPSRYISEVRSALMLGAKRTAQGHTNNMFVPLLNVIGRHQLGESEKPTYFELNKFTKGFQHLIDAYGVAQYQELNPTPYTIITFPFLFAVMFGDVGHGLIMFLFGVWMVWQEKSLEAKQRFAREQNEIFNILYAGRYIILLMGAFSIYTGFIYNDCFSKCINLFGSSWRVGANVTFLNNTTLQLDPAKRWDYLGTPYIVGMDPIWKVAGESSITTFNSLKMKLAIVLGVCQMVFGLVLSAFNFIYKKEYFNFLLAFLPQLIFVMSIFAYLVFLVFFKWLYFGGHNETPYNSACAPSILLTFINMLMLKAPETPPAGCETWMFDVQPYLQIGCLTLALVSVPVLLAGKPIYFILQAKQIKKIKNEELKKIYKRHAGKSIRNSLLYKVESSLHSVRSHISTLQPKEDPKIHLSELWIHSGIHCIESVLGSVSHTASYLRLWALSLAHEQLSTVLWNMVLKVGLTGQRGYWNSLVLYVVFAIWATLTVAILVIMEGLSAFLHTLRLHWVEFQSKFYAGNGEAFQPFYFGESTPNNLP